MAKKKDDEWTVPGTVFAGCVVMGVGLGFLFGSLVAFSIIGVGIGLFASAWFKSRQAK